MNYLRYQPEIRYLVSGGVCFVQMIFPYRMNIANTPDPSMFRIDTGGFSGVAMYNAWDDDHSFELAFSTGDDVQIAFLDYSGPSTLFAFKSGKQVYPFTRRYCFPRP